MNHVPNKFDVETDLKRCFSSSFSPKAFEDENAKTFLAKAEKNLELIKNEVGENYIQAKIRIAKAKEARNPIQKRREDLLTASFLI